MAVKVLACASASCGACRRVKWRVVAPRLEHRIAGQPTYYTAVIRLVGKDRSEGRAWVASGLGAGEGGSHERQKELSRRCGRVDPGGFGPVGTGRGKFSE